MDNWILHEMRSISLFKYDLCEANEERSSEWNYELVLNFLSNFVRSYSRLIQINNLFYYKLDRCKNISKLQ